MTKIAFIGAGSLGFTRGLVRDVLTFPLLKDATLALMDIDPERLDFAYRAVSRIVEMGHYPAKVEATLNRHEQAYLDALDACREQLPEHSARVEAELSGSGRGVVGFFHSHPQVPAWPSPFDLTMAMPCCSYWILHVHDGKAVDSRSWQRTEDGRSFIEEEIVLEGQS